MDRSSTVTRSSVGRTVPMTASRSSVERIIRMTFMSWRCSPGSTPAGNPASTVASSGSRGGSGDVIVGSSSTEVGNDLGPHELDRLHDGLVGDLVRIDEAQQEVDPGFLVELDRLDAVLGCAEHTGVGLDEVLEREEIESPLVIDLLHVRGVGVRAQVLVAL